MATINGEYMSKGNYVFLIGPARSGTKIVRDVLASHPKIDCVPYDINFIWKYGNEAIPHDELTAENFKPRSEKYIRSYLNRFRNFEDNYLIEKTVSNTIRIPYLLKNFPDAKFIFLFRNGFDVIESVMRQWRAPNHKKYLLKKAQTIPFRILIRYGFEFLKRTINRESDSYYWGVKTPDVLKDNNDLRLESIVSKQWRYCIESMLNSRGLIPEQNLFIVKYEELVEKPKLVLAEVLKFIDSNMIVEDIDYFRISKKSKGKSLYSFNDEQMNEINSLIGKIGKRLNKEI